MTDDGLELELLRSKGSQEAPVRIAVDRHHNPRAFAALERWIDHAKIAPGTPLFRRINPSGGIGGRITGDGVSRAIKAALARYYRSTGADDETARRLAARYSGHSGRVGFVVSAKEAGAADTAIAAMTRHRSLEMVRRYGEQAEQRRLAPHMPNQHTELPLFAAGLAGSCHACNRLPAHVAYRRPRRSIEQALY